MSVRLFRMLIGLPLLLGVSAYASQEEPGGPANLPREIPVLDSGFRAQFPDLRIDGIAQGHYGYLWLATTSGLIRFDGRNFQRIQSLSAQQQGRQSHDFRLLLAGDGPVLWATDTTGKLWRLVLDGRPEMIPEARPQASPSAWPLLRLTMDCQRQLVVTDDSGSQYRLVEGAQWQALPASDPGAEPACESRATGSGRQQTLVLSDVRGWDWSFTTEGASIRHTSDALAQPHRVVLQGVPVVHAAAADWEGHVWLAGPELGLARIPAWWDAIELLETEPGHARDSWPIKPLVPYLRLSQQQHNSLASQGISNFHLAEPYSDGWLLTTRRQLIHLRPNRATALLDLSLVPGIGDAAGPVAGWHIAWVGDLGSGHFLAMLSDGRLGPISLSSHGMTTSTEAWASLAGEPGFSGRITGAAMDGHGHLLVASGLGLLRSTRPVEGNPGAARHLQWRQVMHGPVQSLSPDKDGTVWLFSGGTTHRVITGHDGRVSIDPVDEWFAAHSASGVLAHANGQGWLLSGQSLMRLHHGGGIENHAFAQLGDYLGAQDLMALHADGEAKLLLRGRDASWLLHPSRLPEMSQRQPSLRGIWSSVSGRFEHADELAGLPDGRGFLTLDYPLISPASSRQPDYRYRLLPGDREWRHTGQQHQAVIANLPAGQYQLQLQRAMGVWPETYSQQAFTIVVPWWRSPLSLLAYATLAALMAWQVIRQRQRQLDGRQKLALAREKQQFAEQQHLLTAELSATLDPVDIAQRLASSLRQHLPWQHVRVVLSNKLAASAKAGVNKAEHEDDHVAATDKTDAALGNLAASLMPGSLSPADVAGLQNALLTPLKNQDQYLGLVLLEHVPEQGLDPHQQTLLRLHAEIASTALHNALLHTRLGRMAEEAQQLSEAKSNFLATVSHEIRTPLNGVLGMTELLRHSKLDSEQARLLVSLDHAAQSLLHILDELLDLSKAEAGQLSVQSEPFQLRELLEEVVDMFHPSAQASGLTCCLIADALPAGAVLGDGERIQQVLNNLISNAIKFTRSGYVTVHCDQGEADNHWRIAVRDTGIGISGQDCEQVFQPYRQAKEGLASRRAGTGLGLSISSQLINAMGGQITLKSEPGAGSEFSFELHLPPVENVESVSGSLVLPDGLAVYLQMQEPLSASLYSLLRCLGVEARTGAMADDSVGDYLLLKSLGEPVHSIAVELCHGRDATLKKETLRELHCPVRLGMLEEILCLVQFRLLQAQHKARATEQTPRKQVGEA